MQDFAPASCVARSDVSTLLKQRGATRCVKNGLDPAQRMDHSAARSHVGSEAQIGVSAPRLRSVRVKHFGPQRLRQLHAVRSTRAGPFVAVASSDNGFHTPHPYPASFQR